MNTKDLVKTIKHLEINTNRKVNEIFAGNYKSSFRGQGLEVSDLRKYEEGDDARHIDWVITARQGRPYVKKFQETRELTTILLVDVSASMRFTTSAKSKAETAIETTAYILFSAFKNNDKFGVIIFSDKIEAYIAPQKGRRHLLRILREVIQAFDANKGKKTDLQAALDFLNKTIKRQSLCFLLTDEISLADESDKKGLSALKIANKKHDFVYVNIFDEFEREIKKDCPALSVVDPETGKMRTIDLGNKEIVKSYNEMRAQKIAKEQEMLKQSKIDSVSIATDANIYEDLLLFFRKRALKY